MKVSEAEGTGHGHRAQGPGAGHRCVRPAQPQGRGTGLPLLELASLRLKSLKRKKDADAYAVQPLYSLCTIQRLCVSARTFAFICLRSWQPASSNVCSCLKPGWLSTTVFERLMLVAAQSYAKLGDGDAPDASVTDARMAATPLLKVLNLLP